MTSILRLLTSAICLLAVTASARILPVDINTVDPVPFRAYAEQALHGGIKPSTTNEVNDQLAIVDNAIYTDSYCAYFDGTQEANAVKVPLTGTFSIGIRFRADGVKSSGGILCQNVDGTASGIDFIIQAPSVSAPEEGYRFSIGDGVNGQQINSGPMVHNDGLWHDLVAIYTPTHLKLYFDGVASTPVARTVTMQNNPSASCVVRIAGLISSLRSNIAVSGVTFYNRELSADEIIGGEWLTGCLATGCMRNYTFSEGNTSILPQDTSGNNVNCYNFTGTYIKDAVYPHNLNCGYYSSVFGVAPFYPARKDGSGLASNGQPLTAVGIATTGAIHNGAETLFVETDTNLLAYAAWSDTGTNFAERSYSYMTNYYANSNGFGGVYFRKYGDSITWATTYDTNFIAGAGSKTNLLNASYGRN